NQVGGAIGQILARLGATVTPDIVQRQAEANITTNTGGITATVFGGFGAPRITRGFGQDVGAAQEFLTQAVIQTAARQGVLTGVSDAALTAIKNSVATDLETFLADIDFATRLDELAAGLRDANDELAQIARNAKSAAVDLGTQLNELRDR